MSALRNRPASRRANGPEPSKPIRLLVADDHEVVREGLVAMLHRHAGMCVVAVAPDGRQAADLWRRHRPDVGLLDLRMPGLEGVEALLEIRKTDPAARVIVLSSFDRDEDIYRALREGARAYLLKGVGREELLACIRKVHAGEAYVPQAIAAKLATRMSGGEPSARETEVLTLLAQGFTNKEIAARLGISETTVKSHVKGLFAKLHVLSRTEAIAAATRRGLIRL